MAATPSHSPSTFVEMEPPDIATPLWHSAFRPPIVPPVPIHTPHHPSFIQASSGNTLVDSNPVQTLTWEPALPVDNMQICTSPEPSPLSSVCQQDLPRTLPTPRKELQQLTHQVQGNWDILVNHIQTNENTVDALTQELKTTSAHHGTLISQLKDHVENNQQKVLGCISETKHFVKGEVDQLAKTVSLMSTELRKDQITFVSEVRFMMEQLQNELQQDIKSYLVTFQQNHDQMSSTLTQTTQTTETLCTVVRELQTEIKKNFENQERQLSDFMQKEPFLAPVSTPESPAIPNNELSSQPSAVTKSDHLKLTFPTFGKPSDDPDPLLYLARCQDFLVVHPLTDADIMATFRSVLYGTARDWWEVARTSVKTWSQFESAFLSAFLSEDYEDELAERVRTRTQGEKESIRDFAFTYRALCRRWNSTLTDSELVKMILKNVKPFLASQLRSRVNTVDELVKLGQQLEKDFEHQQHYEKQTGLKQVSPPQRTIPNRPTERVNQPSAQCWRCKGHHSPGTCPRFMTAQSFQSSPQSHSSNNSPRTTFPSSKASGPPTNHSVTAFTRKTSANKKIQLSVSVPQQLVVPLSIGSWNGKAIVDTGASYTLLHENLCKEISAQKLLPWTRGPLYLANGKDRTVF